MRTHLTARTSPRVSVILPYYDRASTLLDAIQSVLLQSHPELTLYLINDGSTDDSRDIARSIDDQRIVHIDLEHNTGASHARNVGLSRADTDLVAFIDSDDFWLPRKLEVQIERLSQAQESEGFVSVVGCGWRYVDSDSPPKTFDPGPYTRIDVLANRVPGMGTPKLLVDRSLAVENARFDESIPSLEEGDYVMSCLSNGSKILIVPDVLLEVRRDQDEHLGVARLTALGWEAYLRKYSEEFAEHPHLRSWYAFRAARDHLKSRAIKRAISLAPTALADEPVSRIIHLGAGLVAGRIGLAAAQKFIDATSPS